MSSFHPLTRLVVRTEASQELLMLFSPIALLSFRGKKAFIFFQKLGCVANSLYTPVFLTFPFLKLVGSSGFFLSRRHD